MLHKAVFLDLNGVVIDLPPDIKDGTAPLEGDGPESYTMHQKDVAFLSGVYKAIKSLDRAGYQIVIVSNQSCVGRGFVEHSQMYELFCHVARKIHAHAKVKCRWRFCSHAPDAGCACRKPAPGLMWFYMVNYELDRSKCWMIGDSLSDMHAGHRAEIPIEHLIWIENHYGLNDFFLHTAQKGVACRNLAEAAELILGAG